MADDVVAYSGRLRHQRLGHLHSGWHWQAPRVPAPAGSCILRMGLASFTSMQAPPGMRMRTIMIAEKEFDRGLSDLLRVCDAIPTERRAFHVHATASGSGGSSASSSDQDAGRPMVQPQRAAPPAEPRPVRCRSCLRVR
jgi:hypothetical protein